MRKIIYVLFYLFFVTSCSKDDLQIEDYSTVDEYKIGQTIELGSKLENPYSVTNMQKALKKLKLENQLNKKKSEIDTIIATHYYVRFLPKDFSELDKLSSDTLLELFDYPLDYDIITEGNYYHDPVIPKDFPTYQYTVVPISYNFTDISFEIIDEIYLSSEDNLDNTKGECFYDLLEYEAMRLTGNLDESEEKDSKGLLPSKKSPKGYIYVDNTEPNIGFDGVKHVKVRTQRFAKIGWDYTNVNGYYKINVGYRYNTHYSVIFVNDKGFKVWGNQALSAPAIYNMGKHSKSGYTKKFYTSSVGWLWSTVNNGVYDYREIYCPKYGINKPPSNMRIWTTRTGGDFGGSAPMARQVSMSASTLKDFLIGHGVRSFLAYITKCLPDIFILQDYTDTKKAYSTIFHECAHASHYSKVGKEYWMKYVKHIVNNSDYGDGTETYAGYCGVGEMWGNYFGNNICTKDCFNTTYGWNRYEDWYNPGFLEDVDNISDVTTYEIFSCLTSNIYSINSLKNKLKTKTIYDEKVDNAYNRYTDWP